MADAPGHESAAVAPPPTQASRLFARLRAAPYAISFYQAMRLLEAAHPDSPRLGRSARPAQDAIRLAQEPSVIFAPASLAALEQDEQQPERPPRLLVRFFGLFGPDGPLPLHLTDHARDRARNWRDPTFQRFADIFHHRAMSLFWRAWADSRPTISFDRPEDDRFATYVGALLGLGLESHRDRDAMPDLTKLHFAGLLANQTRHAEGLAAILSAFFDMAVRIECFTGAWLKLEEDDWTRLGDRPRTAALGDTAVLGARIWSRQHKFRIVFGPLSLPEYLRLLPGGGSFHRLIPIVRNYAGDTLMWDVNLLLLAAEVPKTVLGRQGRLGWTTWLMPRRTEAVAADLFLEASADSMAQRLDRNPGRDRGPATLAEAMS
jgi:type VI secretion system protein ImpH